MGIVLANLPAYLEPCLTVDACRVWSLAAGMSGGEVTISYVGPQQMLPLTLRSAALEQLHEIRCDCPRCAGEAASHDRVGFMVEEMHSQVGKGPAAHASITLYAQFREALCAGDRVHSDTTWQTFHAASFYGILLVAFP